ncbi:CapA family protein [Mesorhizobium sp. SP-1A]|uniref:CapA family protein n=1 Tax=Mesorhizobium sp. SP-1A TaxID=3077840 RepID=UPI0028F7117D|nr:CapA family protein [Mesorhizobium sp. SP-1A]
MSNFPLCYKLTWLPRLLRPSLAGKAGDFAPVSASLTPPPARSVRLAFVGDISAVANRAAPVVDPSISALLASADLVVGTCESPVVARPYARFGTRIGTRHAMTETFLAEALEAAGIQRKRLVLSLANNHALDQGAEGFEETRASLARLGIRFAGTTRDAPIVNVGPLRLGLSAFTMWRNTGASGFDGRVAMNPDLPLAESADLVCALPHWDREFRHFPQAGTRALASRLTGQGAALIVGGHAHVVQPVERIGSAVVVYGLGDFLGTALPLQPWPLRLGAVLTAEVSVDAATMGAVGAYRMHFFYRRPDGAREHLLPVEALDGALRRTVLSRIEAVFGPGSAEAQLHADDGDDEQEGGGVGDDDRPGADQQAVERP